MELAGLLTIPFGQASQRPGISCRSIDPSHWRSVVFSHVVAAVPLYACTSTERISVGSWVRLLVAEERSSEHWLRKGVLAVGGEGDLVSVESDSG